MQAGSRNLSRVATLDKTAATLHAGVEEIVAAIEKLPKTRHEIGEAGKFIVDSWPINGVLAGEGELSMALYIGVHGQFVEGSSYSVLESVLGFLIAACHVEPAQGVCSFDRTFLLALAPEGSALVEFLCLLETETDLLPSAPSKPGGLALFCPTN